MKKLLYNTDASAIPIIFFVATIIICGALYTLFFLQIGIPALEPLIPASDSKIFIMMGIAAIPAIVLIVGVISMIIAGLKRTRGVY